MSNFRGVEKLLEGLKNFRRVVKYSGGLRNFQEGLKFFGGWGVDIFFTRGWDFSGGLRFSSIV